MAEGIVKLLYVLSKIFYLKFLYNYLYMNFLKQYNMMINVNLHCEMISTIKLITSHSDHLAGEDKCTLLADFQYIIQCL